MPNKALQQFYNDRRKRGLSDAIIYNELEAAGWSKDGLHDHIAAARAQYERLPGVDFMVNADALEYSLPQPPKPKHTGRIIMTVATMTLYAILSWRETHEWILIIPVFFVFAFVGFMEIFPFFFRVSSEPRRIRLDGQGITVLDPPGRLHPWQTYVGFRAGKKQIPEEEQSEMPNPTLVHLFWKPKPPTRPVVKLYKKSRWMGMTSTDVSLTLPLLPARSTEILARIGKHLQELHQKETTSAFGISWKYFVFGLGFVFFVLIIAIIIMLG